MEDWLMLPASFTSPVANPLVDPQEGHELVVFNVDRRSAFPSHLEAHQKILDSKLLLPLSDYSIRVYEAPRQRISPCPWGFVGYLYGSSESKANLASISESAGTPAPCSTR
eukprot:scaffold24928_cov127-Cylindrotheca_fusiformis.AAC.1